ncbi:MAG: hypothetical protein ACXWJW_02505 [Xanthobacteraceae bacterium]
MRKALIALAATATIAITAVSASTSAEARWRGGGVAAGVIGGIAAGALIAGAARPYGYYGGYGYAPYGYAPAPVYYGGPAYAYGPRCYWQRQRFWDGYGWRLRRVQVCG